MFIRVNGVSKMFCACADLLFPGDMAADAANDRQPIQLNGECFQGRIVGDDLDLARLREGNALQAFDLRFRVAVADGVDRIGGHLVL